MHIQPFRADYPVLERIAAPTDFCERAKDAYPAYCADGLMARVPQTALYVLRITTPQRQHTGLIVLNDVADFAAGRIKKHEKTLAAREEQYHHLLQEWRAVLKPVLLTYADPLGITAWLEEFADRHEPLLDVPFGAEQHQVWAIHEPTDIAHVQQQFGEVSAAYIADGHHRTTTIARFHAEGGADEGLDFSQLYCAYFAADELSILGYHRVVEGWGSGETKDNFLARLQADFVLTPLGSVRPPAKKGELVVVFENATYALQLPVNELTTLDAVLLNERIIGPLLGVEDIRTNKRVSYVEGAKGAAGVAAAVGVNPAERVGFLLHPISFAELAAISDAGQVLPPKSTWFEPRLKSGLLVQSLVTEG